MLAVLFHPPVGAAGEPIATRTAVADGVKLQYLTAGHGPAILLLHGYAETSRMWRPLIPRLASSFTVIAPDLPGIGGSAHPPGRPRQQHPAPPPPPPPKSPGPTKA